MKLSEIAKIPVASTTDSLANIMQSIGAELAPEDLALLKSLNRDVTGAKLPSIDVIDSDKTPIQPTQQATADQDVKKKKKKFKSLAGAISPQEIASYLKGKGFDNYQIAGWLVNIKWESGFKPGAYVAVDAGQGQSGGFFGFHDVVNGRGLFTQMVKFTGGGNKWQTNWQGQLDFALQDPRGQQYKSTKFKSAGAAAHWWVVNYEKPANTQQQAAARAKDAAQYA